MKPCAVALAWLVVAGLAAVACGAAGEGADTDAVAVDGHDGDVDVVDATPEAVDDGFDVPAPPPLVRECGACHDLAALTEAPDGSTGAPRDWLAAAGQGLVRDDPAIPEPGVRFSNPWPHRGRHDVDAGAACDACHPVDDQGHGHDLRAYPQPALAMQGGVGCAEGCHGWLVADGLAPAALLAEGEHAHGALWRQGARVEGMRLAVFLAGCGGCHNARAEGHGAVLTCLDCHTLEGPDGALHQAHVAAIDAGQEAADPEGAAAGVTACGYCHDADDGVPLERWRRGCHGCHLSGHQPLDVTGRPHFWPAAR